MNEYERVIKKIQSAFAHQMQDSQHDQSISPYHLETSLATLAITDPGSAKKLLPIYMISMISDPRLGAGSMAMSSLMQTLGLSGRTRETYFGDYDCDQLHAIACFLTLLADRCCEEADMAKAMLSETWAEYL